MKSIARCLKTSQVRNPDGIMLLMELQTVLINSQKDPNPMQQQIISLGAHSMIQLPELTDYHYLQLHRLLPFHQALGRGKFVGKIIDAQ